MCLGDNLAMESKCYLSCFLTLFVFPSYSEGYLDYLYRQRCADLEFFPVIRYAVATLYSNFSITVIQAEGFGGRGKWVTGKGDDKLVLKIEKLDAGNNLVTGEH